MRGGTAGSGMESLTYYHANRVKVVVRILKRETAGPGMESLTSCQATGPGWQ